MFYVIMTPLVISAILSVIWCIRSMKDTPRTHKYKTPKIERVDSSYVNHAWKETVDSIYSKLVSCGMENISKEDIAKTLMAFLHSGYYKYLYGDKSGRGFASDMVYATLAVLLSSDSLLVDLLKRFNVVDEGFFYVIIKLFQLDNRLNKDFFEDAIMKKNKSDIKNFVEYINTGYGIEGWTLKQCYTKVYE